jgi:hypothetical protein
MANWREPAEPAVFAGADAVLDAGVGAVAQLEQLHSEPTRVSGLT